MPGTPLEPGHWMNRWTQWSEHCRVIELGLWDEPHRNTWVNKLNLAIRRADRPVIVVTDDIAALALAWWVEFESASPENPVEGAVIVNPPNVDLPGADPRLAGFGACPRQPLPFAAFVVSDLDAPGPKPHRSLPDCLPRWCSPTVPTMPAIFALSSPVKAP